MPLEIFGCKLLNVNTFFEYKETLTVIKVLKKELEQKKDENFFFRHAINGSSG